MFLARLVTELLPEEPEALGLLALMLHAEARRRAGNVVRLEFRIQNHHEWRLGAEDPGMWTSLPEHGWPRSKKPIHELRPILRVGEPLWAVPNKGLKRKRLRRPLFNIGRIPGRQSQPARIAAILAGRQKKRGTDVPGSPAKHLE